MAATPLTVTGAAAADFTVTATNCTAGLVLAPAATCTADVRFLPIATGPRTASLQLTHDGKNSPTGVALSGIGNSPGGTAAIAALPASVKFTDLHIGAVSESQSVVISNQGGSAALSVGLPTITAGAPYTITGNTCTGTLVAQGGTCVLAVRFDPGVAGTFNAAISVPSNAASGTLSIPLSGKATAANAAQSAATNVAGFPLWFQDHNGVRVEQCLAQDQNCVLLQDPGFNPALPVVWPTNFPLESFYSLADSELVNVPQQVCADGSTSAGGTAMVRLATEGTFAGVTQATAGAQTWFNRIRITASGLCASTSYTFQHPYGTTTLITDGAGSIRPNAGTFDNANVLGSAPTTPGFLQWDPNVAPAAPAGYLGDARSFHKVVGSQSTLVPGGEPMNYFKVVGPNGVIAQTEKFLVSGRLAGPVVSNPASKDFGSQAVNVTSTTQTFTITNVSTAPIGGFTATSSNATNFVITSNNCPTAASGKTVAVDGTCQVQMQFKTFSTDTAGLKTATLSIGYNGLRSPLVVPVSGTVIAAGGSGLTLTPTSLAFGNVNVGATSVAQSVSIKNAGTTTVNIQSVLAGANPGQYAVTGTTCPATGLGAGATCATTVVFKPTSTGSKPASLAVNALNPATGAVISTSTAGLTGTGAQGTISLSATTLGISANAGTVGTGKLTLTNTGTAPFTLTGAPFYSFTAISGNNPVPRFSASQTGCNAVAPGKNCTVTVSFSSPAGIAKGTVYSVTMKITSDASNSPTSLTVNGTVK